MRIADEFRDQVNIRGSQMDLSELLAWATKIERLEEDLATTGKVLTETSDGTADLLNALRDIRDMLVQDDADGRRTALKVARLAISAASPSAKEKALESEAAGELTPDALGRWKRRTTAEPKMDGILADLWGRYGAPSHADRDADAWRAASDKIWRLREVAAENEQAAMESYRARDAARQEMRAQRQEAERTKTALLAIGVAVGHTTDDATPETTATATRMTVEYLERRILEEQAAQEPLRRERDEAREQRDALSASGSALVRRIVSETEFDANVCPACGGRGYSPSGSPMAVSYVPCERCNGDRSRRLPEGMKIEL